MEGWEGLKDTEGERIRLAYWLFESFAGCTMEVHYWVDTLSLSIPEVVSSLSSLHSLSTLSWHVSHLMWGTSSTAKEVPVIGLANFRQRIPPAPKRTKFQCFRLMTTSYVILSESRRIGEIKRWSCFKTHWYWNLILCAWLNDAEWDCLPAALRDRRLI